MPTPRARLAVLASGGGSNLQAIHDDLVARGAGASAELALVISDRVAAGALQRARGWNVPALHLGKDRGAEMLPALEAAGITHIALAGYLRLVPLEVVRRYHGRMLNVHPALLPAFGGHGMYGQHVHTAAIRAGVRVSGPTVHFVTEQYDEGAIVAQWPVPVRADDTPDTLGQRVLAAEHRLYPLCLHALCSGQLTLGADGRAHGAPDLAFSLEFP